MATSAATGSALGVMATFAIALAACGGSKPATSSASAGHAAAQLRRSAAQLQHPRTQARRQATQARHHRRSHIAEVLAAAKTTYHSETMGPKLQLELRRIASDGTLLDDLSRGDVARAQAAADAQLFTALNHFAHVTRISVIRGSRVLVNATINSDGTFVAAPGKRTLRLHGRRLGTLLVSIQDLTGYVKLVHRNTHADILVRGASGRVRTSLSAAAQLHLPGAGEITIAGGQYFVRSFREIGWGNEPSAHEPLIVWILERT
jgi:hypothetical protein